MVKIAFRKYLPLSLLLPLLLSSCSPREEKIRSPRAIVEKFCQLRYEQGAEAPIWNLVAWEEEPGWDHPAFHG